MVKYIIKRVLIGILTLIVLVAITFAMTKVMPGSPLQSKNVSGEVLQKMEATYGLDKPPVEQFFIYCKNLLHGDMGTSYKKIGKSVNGIIAQTMVPTLKLGAVTFVLVLVVGIGSGILMARSKSNVTKGIWLSALTLGVSVPLSHKLMLNTWLITSYYIWCGTSNIPGIRTYDSNALCFTGNCTGTISNISSSKTDAE